MPPLGSVLDHVRKLQQLLHFDNVQRMEDARVVSSVPSLAHLPLNNHSSFSHLAVLNFIRGGKSYLEVFNDFPHAKCWNGRFDDGSTPKEGDHSRKRGPNLFKKLLYKVYANPGGDTANPGELDETEAMMIYLSHAEPPIPPAKA